MTTRNVVPALLLSGALTATAAHAQAPLQVSTAAGLQAAIESVQEGGIIEVQAGTYVAPGPSSSAPEGGYFINDNGKSFTVRAAAGATVVLDGENARTVLRMINSSAANGRPITFEGLTFARGYSATDLRAGGVTLTKGHATFVNCTFERNRSSAPNGGGGGAVVADGATAFFINTTFRGNTAKNYGGGLVVATGARVYVHNSTFSGNRTNLPGHAANAAGGAVHVSDAILRVTNTLFEANRAGYVGGAIYALGTWKTPESTPAAGVRVANSTFVDNHAMRDPAAAPGPPTEGGAVHAEDQATVEIDYARFLGNAADTGGAVTLYRAVVKVRNSVFQGNVALGRGAGTGFGGAVSAISNDASDASTLNGTVNRRAASLTISDSFFQGRLPGQTLLPQVGGCVFVGGDGNRMYGENGVGASGSTTTNRAIATVTRSAFYECDVEQDAPTRAGGVGGALAADLAQLTLTDVIVINSDALAGSGATSPYGAGGGLALFDQSSATIAGSFFARNSATTAGGGVFVQGATINASTSRFVANSVPSGGYGAAVFSAPDRARNLPVGGSVQTSVFSMNTGALAIYDDDTTPSPINSVLYLSNQIRPDTGTLVYQGALTAAVDAEGLNALTGPRDKGSGNTTTTSLNEPVVGKVLSVPRKRLGTAAPLDLAAVGERTPSYVVYAWGGAEAATINGTPVSNYAGADFAAGAGTQTLSVSASSGYGSASTFTDVVADSAMPSALFTASPASVERGAQAQLSWTSPAEGFVEAAIDQGVGAAATPTGATSVPIMGPAAFRYLAVAESGGTVVTQAVTVTAGAPGVQSFAVVNDAALSFPGPIVTAPSPGQVITVRGVTFSWQPLGGTSGYGLQIFRRSNGQVVFTGSLLGSGSTSTLIALPDGDYTFAVRGCAADFTAANCGAWGTVDFQVQLSYPTGKPSITAPTAGQVFKASTNVYSWTAVTGAASYEVVITDITNPVQPQVAMQVTNASPGQGQPPGTSTIITLPSGVYQMVVKACVSACGPASDPVSFESDLPAPPTTSPTITFAAFGANGTPANNLTVRWTAVPGADLYRVQVLDPTGGPGGGVLTVASQQTDQLTATMPVPPKNGFYLVITQACTGNGCSGDSATVGITTIATAQDKPQIGYPISGTTLPGPLVQFAWSRVPGDTGSNTLYRLYVQDFARAAAALDIFTTQSFYGAYLKAEGTRYDALVFASQDGGTTWAQGPPVGFIVTGTSAVAPTMVAPAHQSWAPAGNIQLGWSPVPGATLYEYFVAVKGQPNATVRGVTTGLFVQVPLKNETGLTVGTEYSGIVRACPADVTCTADSEANWGPWSVNAGPGVTNFTIR